MGAFLERLIYRSEPTGDCRADLDAILPVALWANARHRITGVLASADDQYVQVLEGPRVKLDALLECLRADRRHRNLVILDRRPTSSRLFPGWSMARTHLESFDLPAGALSDGPGLTALMAEMVLRGETRVA